MGDSPLHQIVGCTQLLDEELYDKDSVEKLKNLDLPKRIRDAVNFMMENRVDGPWKHLVAPKLLNILKSYPSDGEKGDEQRENKHILTVLTLNQIVGFRFA